MPLKSFASDADDDREAPPKKELVDIRKLTTLPPISDPAQFLAKIAVLSKSISGNIEPGKEDSADFVYAISGAIIHLQDLYSSEKKLQNKPCAMAFAELLIGFSALLKSQNSDRYVPLPAVANVAPPSGSGIPAGTSPDGIQDPEKRKLYKAAIAKNIANAEMNRFHAAIVDESRRMATMRRYLLETPKIKELVDEQTFKKLGAK